MEPQTNTKIQQEKKRKRIARVRKPVYSAKASAIAIAAATALTSAAAMNFQDLWK